MANGVAFAEARASLPGAFTAVAGFGATARTGARTAVGWGWSEYSMRYSGYEWAISNTTNIDGSLTSSTTESYSSPRFWFNGGRTIDEFPVVYSPTRTLNETTHKKDLIAGNYQWPVRHFVDDYSGIISGAGLKLASSSLGMLSLARHFLRTHI